MFRLPAPASVWPMDRKPNYASDATSVGESTKALEAEGFTGQFGSAEGGQVMCFTCRTASPAQDVHLEAMYRTEGASDPDDMTAVAALMCPACQAKGTVVLHYGPEATVEDSEVLRFLEDRRNESSGGVSTHNDADLA